MTFFFSETPYIPRNRKYRIVYTTSENILICNSPPAHNCVALIHGGCWLSSLTLLGASFIGAHLSFSAWLELPLSFISSFLFSSRLQTPFPLFFLYSISLTGFLHLLLCLQGWNLGCLFSLQPSQQLFTWYKLIPLSWWLTNSIAKCPLCFIRWFPFKKLSVSPPFFINHSHNFDFLKLNLIVMQ